MQWDLPSLIPHGGQTFGQCRQNARPRPTFDCSIASVHLARAERCSAMRMRIPWGVGPAANALSPGALNGSLRLQSFNHSPTGLQPSLVLRDPASGAEVLGVRGPGRACEGRALRAGLSECAECRAQFCRPKHRRGGAEPTYGIRVRLQAQSGVIRSQGHFPA